MQIEKERLSSTYGSMNVYYNQRKGGLGPFGLTAKTAKGGGGEKKKKGLKTRRG